MRDAIVLDHVGLVGRDLGAMLDAYRRLGFAPTQPRPLMAGNSSGRPVLLEQSSAHLVFEQGYVELTSVSSSDPAHHLAAYLERLPSLAILAIGTDDAIARHALCARSGLPVGPVREASRSIEYGSLHGEARFHWFMLEPAASPEGLLCFVQHLTPELVFQREVQDHPNSVRSLSGVLVFAEEAERVAGRMAAALGLGADPAHRIELQGGRLEVLDAAGWRERFPGALPPAGSCLAGFTVAASDLDAARTRIIAQGIEPIGRENGGFWLAAEVAGGCIVEFTG